MNRDNNKGFCIEDYKDILFTVYRLAKERHHQERGVGNQSVLSNPIISIDEVLEKRQDSELLDYLNSLDMDSIKVIQTVMYIGRDYEIELYTDEEMENFIERKAEDPEFQIPEKHVIASDPDKTLNEWMNDIKGGGEWKEKKLEINQIYEKLPLDEYLARAFRILQVK